MTENFAMFTVSNFWHFSSALFFIRWVLLKQALMKFKTSLTLVVQKGYPEIRLRKSQKSKSPPTTSMHQEIKFLVQFASRLVFLFLFALFFLLIPMLTYDMNKVLFCTLILKLKFLILGAYTGLSAWRNS